MIWASLKSEDRTSGVKRTAGDREESEDDEENNCLKKLCRSLGLSGTCQQLESINIASESDEEEVVRANDSSDTSLDISLLLDETRDDGVAERLIREANELVVEIAEMIPNLASTSEENEVDSGNSEDNWGGNRDGGKKEEK